MNDLWSGGMVTYKFEVNLDGLTLTEAQEVHIRSAVQRVVMDALTNLDFGGDRQAAILPLAGNGGATQGMRVVAAEKAAVEQAVDGLLPSDND